LKQFEALGLNENTLKPLAGLGYEVPTPIQVQAIPHVLGGRDLMGLAQTGTGKTAAFGLPLIQLMTAENVRPGPRSVRALILAPTRELAGQIAQNLTAFAGDRRFTVRLVIGGASINNQARDMQRGADILVATPGRLLDLVERGAVVLSSARYLVLDEADQMLDLGFIHALKRIARLVGTPRQTLLFSATMPKMIADLSKSYLTDPVRVEVAPAGRTADRVSQSVHFVAQAHKAELLRRLLSERPDDLSLVFARTKRGAEKLMKHLVAAGLNAASIHGNKSQPQRDKAIRAFRDGDIRVLVATDVAARGIDIPGVTHVYNFDLPDVAESYVHRIGRTARAGAGGAAVAFCSEAEKSALRAIQKLTGVEIEVVHGMAPKGVAPEMAEEREERQPRRAQRSARARRPERMEQRPEQRPEQRVDNRPDERTQRPNRRQTQRPGRGQSAGVRYGETADAGADRAGTADAQALPAFARPHAHHAAAKKPAAVMAQQGEPNGKGRRRRRRRAA